MKPADGNPARIEPRWLLVVALLLSVAAFFLATRLPGLPDDWRVWIVDLSWMAAAAIAGARSLLTALRGRGSDRVAFLLFGLGSVSFAIGMVIWNYHELLLGRATPFPSLADVGFLLAAPLYAAGLIAYQPPAPRPGRLVIRTGHLGLIATALAAVLIIELYDVLDTSTHGVLYQTTALLWPAVYGIAAVFGLFALTADLWGVRRTVLRLLVAAIIVHAVVALLYGEQLLLSVFTTGGEIDVLWILAFALEYGAAVEQDRLAERETVAARPSGPVLRPIETALPPLLIALVIGVLFINRHQVDAGLIALLTPIGIVFAACIAARGWWVLRVIQRIRAAEHVTRYRLETSERRLRNVFETASDGLLVVDEAGRIDVANPAAARLFALPVTELRGRSLAELLGDETATSAPQGTQPDRPARREITLRHPDGSTVPIALRATRLPAAPGEPALSVTLHDLGEQRAAEEARQRAARMAAISQVTAGVAHDFNNLLTVIIGNAEVLEERAVRAGEDEPLASGILAAAERCASLTRRLMAYAQQQPLQPEPVDCATVIDAAIRQLARTWPANTEACVEHLASPMRVLADRVQLEQALIDLLKNALEAMPDGGTVRVRAEAVEVTDATASNPEPAPGAYVALQVIDTGRGMTFEVQARAFEPFYTSKPFGLGAGLGLPMVQGFVKQSGGYMALESTPGQGTRVTLWLPRVADRDQAP